MSNYNTNINPLEQVKNLCNAALRSQKSAKASFVSFFIDAMVGVLTISGRINFLQLARHCKPCEQRFRQNFCKAFDWIAFNQAFGDKHPDHQYAIAIDPSYVSKSGKHTPGISYFWSGCAQVMKRGLEILGIALVDADTREAVAIRSVGTLSSLRDLHIVKRVIRRRWILHSTSHSRQSMWQKHFAGSMERIIPLPMLSC